MQFASRFARIYVAPVSMAELHKDIISGPESIVDLVPSSFVEECAGASAGLGMILDCDAVHIEKISYHTAPAPLAVAVIFILDGAVTDGEQNRTSGFA